MQPLILSVLLSLATPGINAYQNHYRHAHLHARAEATVTDIITTWVTEYVWEDGSPVSPTTSSTSTTNLEAILIQLPTSSSTSTTTTSTSSPVVAITAEAAKEAKVLPSPSSTTHITVPSSNETPKAPIPSLVSTSYAAPAEPSVAGERTFTIINSHTAAVTTAHDDTVGTPTSAGSALKPGTIAPGATATFAVLPGWIGNIAINDANFPITPNSTLIEANFVDWFGTPRADFDVSFVNGFTLPATCSCNGVVTTGCNLNLAALMACPLGTTNNGCANPLRSSEAATQATSFFAPCEGAAWTFVNDGNADSNCQSGPIVCCIGAACPANPKQGLSA